MKLLDNKKCVIISWDQDENIYGIKIKRGKGRKIHVLDACSSLDEDFYADESHEDSFSAKLSAIYKKLYPGEQFLVLMTGNIPGSVCFEMKMPKMAVNDVADAVQYELPRYLPLDLSNMNIGFRVIRQDASNMVLRLFAVRKDDWDNLLDIFRETNIKMDFVFHPFLAVDPWLKERDCVSLQQLYPGFAVMRKPEDQMRHFSAFNSDDDEQKKNIFTMDEFKQHFDLVLDKSMESELDDGYLPCLFITGYAVSPAIQRDQQTLLAPPKLLKPERFRGLKWVFFVLLIVVGGLIMSFLGRIWWEKRGEYMKIESRIKQVKRAITKSQNEMKRVVAFQELADEIYKTEVGNEEVYHGILEITNKLPRDYWVKQLTTTGFNFSLTLFSSKMSSTDFFKRLRNFEVINNYRKNVSGGQNVYITLKYKHPREKKEE